MATRKDQLQSYQFMMQRVISSVMLHETDPEQTPLRRGVGAVFGGVMLAGLLAIAFGVYGVISNNFGNRWQEDGAIVIERETGAHFVYQAGVLRPVLNFASARLLGGNGEVRRVPGRNLAGIQRTAPVGIPGAPDSLPPENRLAGTPWTLCSAVGQDPAASPAPTTVLLVGDQVPGSSPLDDQAVLAREPDGGTYLVWRGHRHEITGEDPDEVMGSLYGLRAQVVHAGSAWLNGLPAGQDIGPIEVEDVGEPSAAVAGRRIGDVVHHPVAGGEQHYLVLDDGLARLTELQKLVVLGHYRGEPEPIQAAEANAAPVSDALAPPAGGVAAPPDPPDLAPVPADGRATLCAVTSDGRSPPALTIDGDLTVANAAVATIVESPEGTRLADWVLVPPGHIAVVRAIPSETADIGSYHLVTDVGLRFAVPSEEVLGLLGYTADQAVEMPAALVQRIPAGPTLDPEAARQPAPTGTGGTG